MGKQQRPGQDERRIAGGMRRIGELVGEQLVIGEDLPAEAVEDLHAQQAKDEGPPEYDDGLEPDFEQFREVERRHGLDLVCELPDGTLKWSSELTPEEEAGGFKLRRDLTAPDPPF